MATTVTIQEAKTQLARLLALVEAGESVTIARAGKPIADLVPHVRAGIVFGTMAGKFAYDPDSFDDVDPDVTSLFEPA